MAWIQADFYSNSLCRPVPLNIIVPADDRMRPTAAGKYKTLYLLHGYYGDSSTWLLRGDMASIAEEYGISIVMPSGNNDFYVDAPLSGKNMSTFISCELVDFTRRLLPLSDKREDTILGGYSMGGFGTLYNCFTHSDVFGHGIALSSPMILEKEGLDRINDTPDFMGVTRGYYRELFGEDLSSLPESLYNPRIAAWDMVSSGREQPNLYIACGYNDALKFDNRKLCTALDNIGVKYFYEEGPGTHDWDFWNVYIRRGIEHVLGTEPKLVRHPLWVEND